MNILQVKEYNKTIAGLKKQKALDYWRSKDNGYGYPVDSMFFFTLTDRQGYPAGLRKKGYIAFDDHRAVFGINKEEAKKRLIE